MSNFALSPCPPLVSPFLGFTRCDETDRNRLVERVDAPDRTAAGSPVEQPLGLEAGADAGAEPGSAEQGKNRYANKMFTAAILSNHGRTPTRLVVLAPDLASKSVTISALISALISAPILASNSASISAPISAPNQHPIQRRVRRRFWRRIRRRFPQRI